MKHPGYSKAKNEYAGRTSTKLTLEQKKAHKEEMKKFRERLKKLSKQLLTNLFLLIFKYR